MASRILKATKSLVAKVQTYVTWLLQRFFPKPEVKERVRDRFGNVPAPTITASINYYEKQREAGKEFQGGLGTMLPETVAPRKSTAKGGTLRYHVKFKFKNPKTGETEDRGYTVDLPTGLRKRDAQAMIRDQIINMLSESDSLRQAGRFDFGSKVGPITVTRIEAL